MPVIISLVYVSWLEIAQLGNSEKCVRIYAAITGRNGCLKLTGTCQDGCNVGKFGEFCNETCDARHEACFNQDTRNCKCKPIFKEYILKVVCVIIGLMFCIKCKNCGLIFIQACSKVHVSTYPIY